MIDPDRECHCVIHEPSLDRDGWDDGDHRLVANVERHGWGVFGIGAEGGVPGWAFTAGIWHTFGHPELAMFGLLVPDMQAWLNKIGEEIRDGRALHPNELLDGVLIDFPVTFRSAHESWFRDLFGSLLWFARRPPPPLLQVVWPDRAGHFPWEPDVGQRCRFDQPSLWLPRDDHPKGRWTRIDLDDPWPFPDSPATGVFTTRRINSEGREVLSVVHDHDGDWMFLDGDGDVAVEDTVLVHLEHIVGAHPHVAEVGDLPVGWSARRDSLEDPWVREEDSPEVG